MVKRQRRALAPERSCHAGAVLHPDPKLRKRNWAGKLEDQRLKHKILRQKQWLSSRGVHGTPQQRVLKHSGPGRRHRHSPSAPGGDGRPWWTEPKTRRPKGRGRARQVRRTAATPGAHLDLLLKLLDLPLQRLHVGDEGHRVGGAGRVHRVLLQLLARLFGESTGLQLGAQAHRQAHRQARCAGKCCLLTLEIWEWNSVMFEPSICPNLLRTSLCQESYFKFTFDCTCRRVSTRQRIVLLSCWRFTLRLHLVRQWCCPYSHLSTRQRAHLAVIYNDGSKLFLGFCVVESSSGLPYLDQERLPLVEVLP